ncbi:MAG: cyclic lactone autoinducer peptide [Oscillospiraceae bacterium]|nr:cyclic lactone autoinducer peptide [Oscillospiraceae bacterium]
MKAIEKSEAVAIKIIKEIAGKMADISCGATSVWAMYQPKEPSMTKNYPDKK